MSTTSLLSKSDQKRQKILDAGRELFMTQGYADTSMDQVTAKSGVSKATVYNHFPSKEILFEEAVKLRSEEVFVALPQPDVEHADPEKMLTYYFHALLPAVMPPLPMMCAGFEPLQPPSIDEVRRAVHFFLRGISADQPST